MTITYVYDRDRFAAMEALGRRIVPDFYEQFFPREWAEWLVENSHTATALEAQVGKGYRHYIIEVEGDLVGYFALHEKQEGVWGLSQFYLLPDQRGKGLGRQVMDFVHRQAEEKKVKRIELYVLRKSFGAVGFYKRHGYVVVAEVNTHMGPMSTVEDYIMRREFV